MSTEPNERAEHLSGWSRLALDAVTGVTGVVESLHQTIWAAGGLLGDSELERTSGVTGFVYGTIRQVSQFLAGHVDTLPDRLGDQLEGLEPSNRRDSLVAILNGVVGDHLEKTGNPLAIDMQFRWRGERLDGSRLDALTDALEANDGRLLLMVHGSSCCEHQWSHRDHNHGERLARELNFVPLYVRYNSGRHISQNGEDLSEMLETLCRQLPVEIDMKVLAHSMGGLVSRSAHRFGKRAGCAWPSSMTSLVCIATPHHGAALERYGNWVDRLLAANPYSKPFARLGYIRSAGVTDLRFGNLCHEDWHGRGRFDGGPDNRLPVPLPDGVACYALAATVTDKAIELTDRVLGDGLVSVASALGRHPDPHRALAFDDDRSRILRGSGHLEILSDKRAYEIIRQWLADQG